MEANNHINKYIVVTPNRIEADLLYGITNKPGYLKNGIYHFDLGITSDPVLKELKETLSRMVVQQWT